MTQTLSEFLVVTKYTSEGLDKLKKELADLETGTDKFGKVLSGGLNAGLSTLAKIVGVAGLASLAVYKISDATVKYTDKLYSAYMTQLRLGGSSLANMKALGQAAEDVGSSVDELANSMAGLQHFQRYFGSQGLAFIQSFIPSVKANDKNDTIIQKLADEIPKLKSQGISLPTLLRYTENAGLNENLVSRLYEDPANFKKYIEEYKKAGSANEDKAKAQALSTEQSLKQLSATADSIKADVYAPLMSTLQTSVDWIKSNRELIENGINEAQDKFSKTVDIFEKAVNEFAKTPEQRAAEAKARAEGIPEPSTHAKLYDQAQALITGQHFLVNIDKAEEDLMAKGLTRNEAESVWFGSIQPESHGDINAVNKNGAFGLFQLLDSRFDDFKKMIESKGLTMEYLLQNPNVSYDQQMLFFDLERRGLIGTEASNWKRVVEAAKRSKHEGTHASSKYWSRPGAIHSVEDELNERIAREREKYVIEHGRDNINNTKVEVYIDGQKKDPKSTKVSYNNYAPRYQQQRMA